MEQLKTNQFTNSALYITLGLSLLVLAVLFGLLGSIQYIIPGFIKQYFSFEKVRPLHVSSVVFWILMATTGGVLTYLQQYNKKAVYSLVLLKIQFILFVITIPTIFITYMFGHFGGREYWEFNPILALPILLAWLCFIFNFLKSIISFKNQPVYIWMWLTGLAFFLFTFIESYLWLIPYFRINIVNDITIQWKSYGSMVGSWNMLIYGCTLFLMEKISGNKSYSRSKIAFLLYFIGLTNLMFNWGHHIYLLPTHNFIKHISYIISMTELFIIGRIIYKWKVTLNDSKKFYHHLSYRFIMAADWWILLTLLLAILMSVPAINVYTHGTHITVAHTMGATIGINTFLLLAIAFDIFGIAHDENVLSKRHFNFAFWLINLSLFVFWVSLLIAGVLKSFWQMSFDVIPFSTMMNHLRPFFILFFISGFSMVIGFYIIILPILKFQFKNLLRNEIK